MRRTIITLLLLAGAAWVAPPQIEDAQGQCRALESLVRRAQAQRTPAAGAEPVPADAVVQRVLRHAQRRHADWPTGLACFATYWELAFDTDLSLFQADTP